MLLVDIVLVSAGADGFADLTDLNLNNFISGKV